LPTPGARAWNCGRDPIRLAFALFGTLLLMLVFGYGITFDVENIAFAVLDRDQTPESRAYIEEYESSSYFLRRADVADSAELVRRLRANEIALAIEIPPDFGADLRRGRATELSIWIDGGMPFRAETIEGYVAAAHRQFVANAAEQAGITLSSVAEIATRFRYNQAFRSLDAMVPALFAMMLMLIRPFLPLWAWWPSANAARSPIFTSPRSASWNSCWASRCPMWHWLISTCCC
jgi:hypothetical protein